MPLNLSQRYEIIFLHLHPQGSKLSIHGTAKAVRCDEKTVRYWVKRWEENQDLSDKPKTGWQKVTTQWQDKWMVELAKKKNWYNSSRNSKGDD